MRIRLLAVACLVGCGGPVLRNAPRPNPTVMAAAAAAVAGAATLADPDAAAKRQEQKKEGEVAKPPQKVTDTVPHDVLDRLDEAERNRKNGDED